MRGTAEQMGESKQKGFRWAQLILPMTSVLAVIICLLLSSCAPAPSPKLDEASEDTSAEATLLNSPFNDDGESESDESPERQSDELPVKSRLYAPLSWDINTASLVGRQGTTALWGACGECCIANSLNLVTGSSYTESDIVSYCLEHGLCDPTTGGMTLQNMADAYKGLIEADDLAAYGYGGDYAPSLDAMARRLDQGILLNVAVYGEMMREGGHTSEGDIYSTHWIVLHSVDRNADGSVAGFGIIDSASSITYLTAQELSDYYYGHDGTNILDPSCVLIYRWEYAD